MDDSIIKEFQNQIIAATPNASLKKLTTFRIGGNCGLVVEPCSCDEIDKTLALCRRFDVEYAIIGNGSNILAADDGFDGVIIKLGVRYAQVWADGNSIFAQSGATVKSVYNCTLSQSLSGAEFLSAIPASVGGAIFMNAGCFGAEVKDIVKRVWATDGNEERVFAKEDLNFGYRQSIFQKNGFVITKVEFDLFPSSEVYIKKLAAELQTAKRMSQPLEYFSAGSVFKRPDGAFAGQLIDRCGLKGLRIGDAEVSSKHAGFIINKGHATCKDVLTLIETVKNKVKDAFGVELQLELKLLGSTDDFRRLSYAYDVQSRHKQH